MTGPYGFEGASCSGLGRPGTCVSEKLNGAFGLRASTIRALYMRPCLVKKTYLAIVPASPLATGCIGLIALLCLYRTNFEWRLGVVIISLCYWGFMGFYRPGFAWGSDRTPY